MSSHDPGHIRALTSLRFLAALHVLFFHSGSSTLDRMENVPDFVVRFFHNGYLGVSFFFILSGFILAYVYYEKPLQGRELWTFARARFARVYPVLFLSLVLMVPFVDIRGFWKDVWQFLMLQTWMLEAGWSNWNMQAWTLSVELFFYICFPFILMILRRAKTPALVWVVAGLICLMTVLRLPETGVGNHHVFEWMRFLPPPVLRMPEFIFGVCLAILFVRNALPHFRQGLLWSAVAVLLILSVSSSYWVAPPAAICFGATIALVSNSEGALKRLLQSEALVLLGKASYAIYLLQLPVRYFVRDFFESRFGTIAAVAYFPLLIGISVLVYLYWEEPMRRMLRGERTAPPRH